MSEPIIASVLTHGSESESSWGVASLISSFTHLLIWKRTGASTFPTSIAISQCFRTIFHQKIFNIRSKELYKPSLKFEPSIPSKKHFAEM